MMTKFHYETSKMNSYNNQDERSKLPVLDSLAELSTEPRYIF